MRADLIPVGRDAQEKLRRRVEQAVALGTTKAFICRTAAIDERDLRRWLRGELRFGAGRAARVARAVGAKIVGQYLPTV